ncbi:MAG TPA: hypothetical protein VHQ47_11710 [Phycisphaerae bacterium]|nr:hypothetical protein [Phycisphaerae bacterium]
MLNITNSVEDVKRAGQAHYQAGRFAEGLAAFELATRLDPASAASRHNVGLGLFSLRRCDESVWHFERALAMEPRLALGWNSLGAALLETGRPGAAVQVLRRGVELHPGELGMHSFLICALALAGASRAEVLAETAAYAGKFAPVARPAVQNGEGRRLRVGFVSGDFRLHAVAWFFEPLLRELPGAGVEAFCYSHVGRADEVTGRLRGLAGEGRWREIGALGDDAAAEVIRGDTLDVVVDLMGHTAGNRLGIFVRRPVGVQVSWLGYAGPAPLGVIDARLTDGVMDAGEAAPGDPVVKLETFAPHGPPGQAVEVWAEGRREGRVTFACVSNPVKWSEAYLRACAGILELLPEARLVMVLPGMDPVAMGRVQRQFSAGAGGRVEFRGVQPFRDYLLMHQEVDVVLDTFPVSGHTVTCHALRMGVPVVTRAGAASWGRLTASVLRGMGKREWIAETEGEFIEAAVLAGRERAGGAEARERVRAAFLASPAADAAGFSRRFAGALRGVVAEVAERAARVGENVR